MSCCCMRPVTTPPERIFPPAQWQELVPLFRRRNLLPYIDMAYQGLGTGQDEDAVGIRLFAAELPEVLVAVSCSKNFGLYRERVGVAACRDRQATAGVAALSHEVRVARSIYSMPPDHGAAIVNEILGNDALRAGWVREVGVHAANALMGCARSWWRNCGRLARRATSGSSRSNAACSRCWVCLLNR